MRYIKWVNWQPAGDLAALGYSKIDTQDYEVEEFEFFRDRTWHHSTSRHDKGRTALGDQKVGSTKHNNELPPNKNLTIWMWDITQSEYDEARENHVAHHKS